MSDKNLRPIPEPTLRRLPAYHEYLKRLQAQGKTSVSCTHIGEALRVYSTQVRKDLAVTGIVGRPKTGYDVTELMRAIESFLGWDDRRSAFLAGVGSLGSAILGYRGFQAYGLKIVAGFDSNPDLVGKEIHGKAVLPIEKLAGLARRMHVHMGIITVPAEAAQDVADRMIEGGIFAIWNFAPTSLKAPEGVVIQNENLASSLAVLSKRLENLGPRVPGRDK